MISGVLPLRILDKRRFNNAHIHMHYSVYFCVVLNDEKFCIRNDDNFLWSKGFNRFTTTIITNIWTMPYFIRLEIFSKVICFGSIRECFTYDEAVIECRHVLHTAIFAWSIDSRLYKIFSLDCRKWASIFCHAWVAGNVPRSYNSIYFRKHGHSSFQTKMDQYIRRTKLFLTIYGRVTFFVDAGHL